jgi:hypothetical protein
MCERGGDMLKMAAVRLFTETAGSHIRIIAYEKGLQAGIRASLGNLQRAGGALTDAAGVGVSTRDIIRQMS